MAINLYSKASVDSLLSGKLSVSSLSNGAASAIDSTVPTTGKVLSFDGTKLKWVTPAAGATWGSITGTLSTQSDLNTALNARLLLSGGTMGNNAQVDFNDTFNNTSLGLNGNGVTAINAPAPYEYSNLTFSALTITDGTDTMLVERTGLTFPDSTVQTTAYTGGGTFVGDRLSIYAGYLYNEQTASNVTALTLQGVSTVTAKNLTMASGAGGVLTFSDGTTQSSAPHSIPGAGSSGQVLQKINSADYNVQWATLGVADISGAAPIASPTFTGTVTIPAGASISGYLTTASASSTYAPLASPTLTGTPLSTTAAADTNTTQIATTAFVVGQASSTTPAATGTAAVGTSLKYARADHVHANPLPTGGTAGQVLSKVDGTNYNVQWVAAGGGGGGVDVQTFGSSTTSGSFTWTKPSGAKWVEIILFGAGGGGGSGAREPTTSNRYGGGGGGGGTFFYGRIAAAYLGSTESVVVGAKGTGGSSQTSDTSFGNAGTSGSNTTFSIYQAVGGSSGARGTATGGAGGAFNTSSILGMIASNGAGAAGTSTTGNSASSPTNGSNNFPSGAGGGGGAASGSTTNAAGGSGGSFSSNVAISGISNSVAGGTGGDTSGTAATAGTSSTTQYIQAGTGGGGGAYRTGVAGGAGGNGGWPGGGGGGGGASDNGFASGKGGDGGNGYAVIITYF